MKIIEAMKEIKRLEEKVGDLKEKISRYCVDMDIENPTYPDQKGQVNSWLQSVTDTLKEAMRLRILVQKTNLEVQVSIELGGVQVSHSIAEWILRRRLYAAAQEGVWAALSNKNLRDGFLKDSKGEQILTKVRLYYDPVERDKKVEEYRSEPSIIDRTLEVVNATTDLIE